MRISDWSSDVVLFRSLRCSLKVASQVPKKMERLMLDREPDAKREEQVPEGDAKESGQSGSAWLETLRTIVIDVLIAVGVRTFAYEPFNIPSKIGRASCRERVGKYV